MKFDELVSFLDGDHNEYGLSAIATHGFLTACVVGKPLKNWQSLLFEGQEKQVSKSVLQALDDWRLSLLATLQDEKAIELPFDVEDTNFSKIDDSELAEWSVGFVDAMYASEHEEDDWFLDGETEEDVAMLTLPMIVFSGIDDDPEMQVLTQDVAKMTQMAKAIEQNLVELFLLFHTES